MGANSDGDSNGIADSDDEQLDDPGDGGDEGFGLLGRDTGIDASDDDSDIEGDGLDRL